jgi:phosphoribosylformylglycinamidine cyclo-ligase
MADNKDIYSQLGVSSKKEDVHKAIEKLDKGLFPGAFCTSSFLDDTPN